jgi:hypothetical protein
MRLCHVKWLKIKDLENYGAEGENRTRDPLITNEVLYQLSYLGPLLHNSIRAKFLSIERQKLGSISAAWHRVTVRTDTSPSQFPRRSAGTKTTTK